MNQISQSIIFIDTHLKYTCMLTLLINDFWEVVQVSDYEGTKKITLYIVMHLSTSFHYSK